VVLLIAEGVPAQKFGCIGTIMVDSFAMQPSNVDDRERLAELVQALV
jgi:hypothetical protein